MTIQQHARYHSLQIALHWLMAFGIVFMFASGLYMVYADIPKAEQYKLFQVHKASGVIMLWAIVARIGVKLFAKQPPLPCELTTAEQKKAKVGHALLYLILVIMPVSGWFMVSASPFGLPTLVFVEWLNWPHIAGIAGNNTIETAANMVHWMTALIAGVLILGHIVAVVWHKRKHSLNLLTRMWWSRK